MQQDNQNLKTDCIPHQTDEPMASEDLNTINTKSQKVNLFLRYIYDELNILMENKFPIYLKNITRQLSDLPIKQLYFILLSIEFANSSHNDEIKGQIKKYIKRLLLSSNLGSIDNVAWGIEMFVKMHSSKTQSQLNIKHLATATAQTNKLFIPNVADVTLYSNDQRFWVRLIVDDINFVLSYFVHEFPFVSFYKFSESIIEIYFEKPTLSRLVPFLKLLRILGTQTKMSIILFSAFTPLKKNLTTEAFLSLCMRFYFIYNTKSISVNLKSSEFKEIMKQYFIMSHIFLYAKNLRTKNTLFTPLASLSNEGNKATANKFIEENKVYLLQNERDCKLYGKSSQSGIKSFNPLVASLDLSDYCVKK